jgi:Cu/Ag efflux pump CusA
LKSTQNPARDRIARTVTIPDDTHIEMAGEINALRGAERPLALAVPLTLL